MGCGSSSESIVETPNKIIVLYNPKKNTAPEYC